MNKLIFILSFGILINGCAFNERSPEEQQAREKYGLCSTLAEYTYKDASYKEVSSLKKIRSRGYDDAECQRHYDAMLNRYMNEGRRKRTTTRRLIIDRNLESLEKIRVVDNKPDNCKFIAQGTCPKVGAECLNWHKERAAKYSANTVVVSDVGKDRPVLNSQGGGVSADYQKQNKVANAKLRASYSSDTNISLTYPLADYYNCVQ